MAAVLPFSANGQHDPGPILHRLHRPYSTPPIQTFRPSFIFDGIHVDLSNIATRRVEQPSLRDPASKKLFWASSCCCVAFSMKEAATISNSSPQLRLRLPLFSSHFLSIWQ